MISKNRDVSHRIIENEDFRSRIFDRIRMLRENIGRSVFDTILMEKWRMGGMRFFEIITVAKSSHYL